MSEKTLNKANLADLGIDRLADLLIEVSQGSAASALRYDPAFVASGICFHRFVRALPAL
jgi:hypothetical protein